MEITLNKPEFRRFVEDEVRSGRFGSPAEVIEAGLARLMDDREPAPLDDETIAALAEADAQIERGEGIDFDKFAADMRARYGVSASGR